jgi:CheY-like chemotaxis protein/DNA-binding CsgD family transcriptional regulator
MDLQTKLEKLTEREKEIVYLLVNTDDIGCGLALSLGIKETTLRQHATKIYTKLGISGRLELINKLRCHFCEHQNQRNTTLVVDDDENWLLIVQSYLEVFNLDVITANSGRSAIEMMRKKPPDLVVLDLMMPDVDGYQVLKEMRSNPYLRNIPVIIITAKDITLEDKQLGLPLLPKGDHFEEAFENMILQTIRNSKLDSDQDQ